MNKNQYRIIFNARRGIRMAVAETATSCGKSADGASASRRAGNQARRTACHHAGSFGKLAASLVLVYLSIGGIPAAQAQIVADKSAPGSQQPTVLQTANGLPQINITTPSAAGVSRNTYSQFDVQKAGVILNNSGSNVQTQTGGYVQGNPWLAAGSARVILNEVNSTKASQINGYVEVAGQRAEVVIANPAGIAVSGGGFINAGAVTLTTGAPVVNNGSLESYRVRGGAVVISADGLDTSTADYTNILARAVQLNAGIWAKDLKVVTGLNQISASDASNPSVTGAAATSSTAEDAAPAFALDVAALGGMYAGKITMIGTEAGFGVRNSGVIGATAGNVAISNNGWLSNSGSIYASANTTITTDGDISNTGTGLIAAKGDTTLSAKGQNDTGVASQVSLATSATLAAGMDSSGAVGTTGNLSVTAAGSSALQGQMVSGATTTITATAVDVSGATLTAQDAALIAGAQAIDASDANVAVQGTISLQAQTTVTTDGATVNAAQINITAHDLSNVAGKLQQSGSGDTTIALAGNLNNTDGSIASNAKNLTLSAAVITNKGGDISHAGTGALTVTADAVEGSGGSMVSNGALHLQASGAVALQNATTSGQQIDIQAASLGNQGGRIVQSGSTLPAASIVLTGALDNEGGFIGSNTGLQINAGGVSNASGQLVALQSLEVTSTGAVNNTAGLVQSGATLSVNASQIINAGTYTAPTSTTTALGLVGNDIDLATSNLNNQGGEVLAAKNLTVNALQVSNAGGTLNAGTTVYIKAASFSGDGKLLSQGDLSLDVSGDFNNTGTVNANGNTEITSGGTVDNSGTLASGKTLTVVAVNMNNTVSGTLSGVAGTRVILSDTLTNRGLIDSGNDAGTGLTLIKAQTANNVGTGRIYGDDIAIAATTLVNDAETVAGVSKAAVIASRNALNIGVQSLSNFNGATLLSLGDMAIGGALDSNHQATGYADTVTNSASTVEALGSLTIHSGTINNLNPTLEWTTDGGTTGTSGTVYFTGAGTYDTADGAVLSPASGSLVARSNGGYSYYQIVGYTAEETCVTSVKGNETCTPTGNMIAEYGYGKGAAQPDSNSGASSFDGFATYTQTNYRAVVTKSTPGRIASGGDMTLVATSAIVNDQSEIVAGGSLTITAPSVDNKARTITLNAERTGTGYYWSQYDEGCGNVKGCNYNYQAYRPQGYQSEVASTQVLDISVAQSYSSSAVASSAAVDAAVGGGGVAGASAAKSATPKAAAAQNASTADQTGSANQGVKLPNSSLFKVNSSPTAQYLVETDPAFTNYKQWLSSDYITSRISLDPTVTQKRLGDGFYEQQLIREQVGNLTGRRFLGDYTSDQPQYQGLMDAGITFASTYQLREGIALSATQVAQLTSDIVWLQAETVTLPDGTTTQALVPHLYAAVRAGDLAPSGALLGGNTVSITTTGDVNNSGTILGRKLVQISANSINNVVGSIAGQSVSLSASQDINNTGGTIVADNNLSLVAGRNINIASTTQSSSGTSGTYAFNQTGIDRVASVRTKGLGTLLASAGNNITLTAAQVSSGGDVQMAAGNNLTLNTITTGRTDNFNAGDADNYFLSGSSKEAGSTIQSTGNTTLSAGNTLFATAANVQATGDLSVNASNIVLQAGQSKASTDAAITTTSGDMFTSTTTVTKQSQSSATAQVSKLKGSNVTITAEQDLVSVGTKFAANDTLTVEGKNSQTFYAAKDVSQSSKTVESSTSMFGGALSMAGGAGLLAGAINLGSSSSTDNSATAVSIASELSSTQAINVRVGNSATLEGASLTAQQIAFTKTDPTKAGQLNLNGSTDTTQTSRTEKSDTLGLFQSQSGSGSTTQTLNLSKLNGNVTFDKDLSVAVQVPNTVTTSGQTANTAAASNASTTTSQASVQAQIDQLSRQPGLEYLSQLSNKAATANPAQWSQVQLAHDNWSYSQQGLTPAGAALLSIAVAAYTGGMGAEMLGGTAATTTSSAALMGSTTLATAVNAGFATLAAQASVAMVNNGGDIGKTLEQLGSSESIKNLLVTMATAGALDALNANMTIGNVKLKDITPQSAGLGANLAKNVINNLANATITSTLTGANLEDSLNTALVSAMVSAGAAKTAGTIGDLTMNDQLTKAMAHALAGCVAGAAGSGSQGCNSGAVGAVVGELAAQWYDNPPGSKSARDVLSFAKVMSAAAGAITGDGSAASVNTAVMTGANAVENNYLAHSEATARAALRDKQTKGTLSPAEQQQLTNLEVLDIARDLALKDACQTQGDACNAARRDLNAAIGSYANVASGYNAKLSTSANGSITAELNQNVALSNDPMLAQQTLVDSFMEFAVPQAAGYAAGAVLGKFIAEAQAVYAAVRAESGVATGAVASGASGGVNPTLLNELTVNGVKFTPANVIATARVPSGQIVFLETGNSRAGLQHIVGEHANDFAKIGVSQAEIPNVVMQAVTQGKIVGYQGAGTGRPILETVINGQPRRLAITISDNGFIVGANPKGIVK